MHQKLLILRVLVVSSLIVTSYSVMAEQINTEILEYGYYEVTSESRRYRNPATATGYVRERKADSVKLVKQTDRIPAELKRLFGFKFRVSGFDDMLSAQLVLKVTHPEIQRANGSIATSYTYPVLVNIENGVIENQTGYSMDQKHEVVEGKWVFELWYYKQKLVSQAFYTYFPNANDNEQAGNSPQIEKPSAGVAVK